MIDLFRRPTPAAPSYRCGPDTTAALNEILRRLVRVETRLVLLLESQGIDPHGREQRGGRQ